jgi:hypothetical protein
VTLSYLATGFDWQANYVASLAPSEDRMTLFAWVTLANGDETGFVRADTQTVAGRLNRERANPPLRPTRDALHLQCWPDDTTSDVDGDEVVSGFPMSLQSAPPPPPPMAAMDAEGIVVTGMRAKMVQQEELGDLKLYRVPVPVTVASNSQKQVALLDRTGIKVESFYRLQISPWWNEEQLVRPVRILKMRNRKEDGLGVPLPAGGIALFREGYLRPVLVGQGSTEDKAIGEDVELEFSEATGVFVQVVRSEGDTNEGLYRLTVTNDRDRPIRFDAEFGESGQMDVTPTTGRPKFGRRNGRPVWSVTVPANGSTVLDYRLRVKS